MNKSLHQAGKLARTTSVFLAPIAFAAVFACKERPVDSPAKLLEGQYEVSHYIIGQDTLISPKKGNISPFPHFSLRVSRLAAKNDKINILVQTTSYGGGVEYKNVELKKENDGFELVMPGNTIDVKAGYADGKTIRFSGAGLDVETMEVIYTTIIGTKI